MDVCGCQLSNVVNTGQTDRERQRLRGELRVPVETERDGQSEEAAQAENHGAGQAVEQDQLQSPGTA